VACRSRGGRGWAYASLRFDLDECGRSMLMSMVRTTTSSRDESGATASAPTPMLASDTSAPMEQQHAGAERWNVSRLRQRWLQFQQRQVSRCRVFLVPCVTMLDDGGGDEVVFRLARPAFDLRWLRPLSRLADAHYRRYVSFMVFFLAVPSIAVTAAFSIQNQERGISTLVLNVFICIMALGFMCSKRYGLDRVAVRHVALSFRFTIFVTLLAADLSLTIREVFTIVHRHPASAVSSAFTLFFFVLCIMFDCSPHLPPMVQIYISVIAHKVRMNSLSCKRLCRLHGACFTDISHFPTFKLFILVVITIASSILESTRFALSLRGSPFTSASCC
jgi:hypothetical protein